MRRSDGAVERAAKKVVRTERFHAVKQQHTTQMKRPISQITDNELLALSQEDYQDSIRLEAIERGIKPPITLSEALRSSEWMGFRKPAEAIPVFRVGHGYHRPMYGYLNEKDAENALTGIVMLEDCSWKNSGLQIKPNERPEIIKDWVTTWPEQSKSSKLEQYTQDDDEFDALVKECNTRLSTVRQSDYNRRVDLEKRAEYLRLAGNNEEIAKAFWSKTERREWPSV